MLQQLYENISKSITHPFQWLPFNNQKEQKGICEAYNTMAKKAIYDNLIFIHEDIILESDDWNFKLIKPFEKYDYWGVAGSNYKSAFFSGWATGIKEFDAYYIKHQSESETIILKNEPSENQHFFNAVILDGVFLAIKKKCWEKVLFNEKLIKGFHAYDTDITIRANLLGFKGGVVTDLRIIHLTDDGGNFGNDWMLSTIATQKALMQNLPIPKENYSLELEMRVAIFWLDFLKNQKISFKNRVLWINLQKLYFYPVLYYSIFKFLLYAPLMLKYLHTLWNRNSLKLSAKQSNANGSSQ
jgi:hypothetical protein